MQAIKSNLIHNLRAPALISTLLVLPFVVLELVNRRGFNEGFPVALFGLLWLLPLAFSLLLLPIMRRRPEGAMTPASRLGLWTRMAAVGLIVFIWIALVADQMPCFLGRPNCD